MTNSIRAWKKVINEAWDGADVYDDEVDSPETFELTIDGIEAENIIQAALASGDKELAQNIKSQILAQMSQDSQIDRDVDAANVDTTGRYGPQVGSDDSDDDFDFDQDDGF